jgi:flagellin
MSRINTNVSALIAQNTLARSNSDLQVRLQRLSTGLQINRGADNPAGLIVSERLRSEINGITQAIGNAERAVNVIATTESALAEVSGLLNDIKGLIVEAANTGAFSKEEIAANQLQIDSAVQSITRISNTTTFAGLQLLNGSLDYLTSGVNAAEVQDVKIFNANFGTSSTIPLSVEVLASADTAQLFISGNTAGAAGALLSSVTFEIQGPKGVDVVSFVSGVSLSAVVFAVNQRKDATGVSAFLASATNQTSGIVLTSTTFGSEAFVSVRKLDDGAFFQSFDAQGGNAVNRDTGSDVLALINGNLALGDGTEISLRSGTLNIEMNLTVPFAQTLATSTFAVTGGGSTFQIGPTVNSNNQVGFGVQSVAASRLGNEALGFLNSITSGGDNSLVGSRQREAGQIVEKAIDQVSSLRGQFGAFERNTLQVSVRSQQIALENLTSAESRIRDTDFASETSKLTRAQILASAGTSTLAIANSSAQNVLSLLG